MQCVIYSPYDGARSWERNPMKVLSNLKLIFWRHFKSSFGSTWNQIRQISSSESSVRHRWCLWALWAQEASSDEGRLSQDGRWTEVSGNKENTSLTLGLSPLTPSGLSVLHQTLPWKFWNENQKSMSLQSLWAPQCWEEEARLVSSAKLSLKNESYKQGWFSPVLLLWCTFLRCCRKKKSQECFWNGQNADTPMYSNVWR